MFTRNLSIALISAVALVLATTSPLHAIPTSVVHQDAVNADGTTHCDPLFIPQDVDEIGTILPFPLDEALDSVSTTTTFPVCTATDDVLMPEELVFITNLTGRDLTEVWYIANNETRISNFDGYANDIGFAVDLDNETFRIDSDISDPGGAHHPLVGESGVLNDIWEAGETWEFILQDYGNLFGLPGSALTSIGVGDASGVPGVIDSSGSIIAIPQVPEPGSTVLALLAMSAWGLVPRRKRG
jgi:hypothetical protein